MMEGEQFTERYKGIEIRVEKITEFEYDGVFTWNGKVIRTDPLYEYASSPQQAIESARGVIDTLLRLRREGVYVAEDK